MKLFTYIEWLANKISDIYYNFFDISFIKKTLVIMLSFLISLVSVILLFKFVDTPLQYRDFIVGSSTWRGEGKTVDLIAGPLFAFVFILFFGFLSSIFKKSDFSKLFIIKFKFLLNYKVFKFAFCLLIFFASIIYLQTSKFHQNDLRLSVLIVSTISNDYQIFYDTGLGFNEAESIRKSVSDNARFRIPKSKITQLRIDPGSKPGVIEINKICLSSGKEVICFRGDELLKNFTPKNHISTFELINNNLHIVSSGNDPYFIYTGKTFPFSINVLKLVLYFCFVLFAIMTIVFFKSLYANFLKYYLYWFTPFVIIPVDLLMKRNINHYVLLPSIFAIFIAVISFIYSKQKNKSIDVSHVNYLIIISMMFMVIPLSLFSIFKIFDIFFFNPKILVMWFSLVLGFSVLSVTIFYGELKKNLNGLFIFSQLSLPFLFLNIIPQKLNTSNFGLISYNYSWILYFFAISLIAISFYDLVRRYKKNNITAQNEMSNYLGLLSPLTLFALLMVLKMPLTAVPAVSSDDYHFGEQLLGTWSYLKGIIPYVEYLPAHGMFVDDFAAFINIIFFDGLAGHYNQARVLGSILIGLITFIAFSCYLKNSLLAFFILFLFPWIFQWIVLVPFLCLWLDNRLLSKPSLWISFFMVTSPLLVLFVPPQGGVLVAPFLIVFTYCSYKFLKKPLLSDFKLIGIAGCILLFFTIFTPFLKMFLSACKYVIENADINQPAYGVSIFLSWRNLSFFKIFVQELMRNTWVLVIISSFITAMINFRKKDKIEILKFFILPLFIMLMISYAMGRIDPGRDSRPGILTIFSIFILLPIIFKDSRRYLIIMTILFVYASYFKHIPDASGNLNSLLKNNINTGILVNGNEYGLKNLGVTHIQSDHLERLKALNEILQRNLFPDETYLDLTSRNAHYFYLDKIPPVSVTAPYNMVSIKQQITAINDIDKKEINLAIFSADNIIHDGGGLALRSPLLFRYIYLNYTPFQDGNIIYGLRNGSEILKQRESLSNSLQMKLSLFEGSFSTKNLALIPHSWGLSYNILKNKLVNEINIDSSSFHLTDLEHSNGTLKISGENPAISYNLEKLKVSGLEAGVLVLNVEFNDLNGNQYFQLIYRGDEGRDYHEKNNLHFNARNGYLIIPLDTQPRWLSLKQIKSISLKIENPDGIHSFRINSIKLYQRKVFEETCL